MSKKVNPTLLGAFIVAGLLLGVIGLIIFSSTNFFSAKHHYVLYFESTMKGMAKGAAVQFKGVTIGTVVEVFIAHNQGPDDHAMPLVIEIDEALLRYTSDRRLDLGTDEQVRQLINAGLRARLDAASFVTGVLMVQLDFVPNAGAPVYHQVKHEYVEIPTVHSEIEILLDNLGKVDIQGIAKRVDSILAQLDVKLGDLDVKAISAGATRALDSIDRLAQSEDLAHSLRSLHRTLDDFDVLTKNIDSKTLDQVAATLTDLRLALQNVSTVVAPDASIHTELLRTLEQVSNASRSIAELADFLRHNPNTVIVGRVPPHKATADKKP